MMNGYLNAWSSIMNVPTRFIAAHPEFNFGDTVDFDNVDGENLPPGNLTGIYQFDYTVDDSLVLAQCTFPISTELDVSALTMNKAVGQFVNFVQSQSMHPFYNYDNQAIIGHMKAVNNLSVSPMIKTKSRQFKFILQSFAFDRTTSFPAP